jgi:uncharacterized protein with LGFP repeats
MTGLRTLVGTRMTGATAGLVMAAAFAFLVPTVPMASADPASDADAAITAAWDAGGGPTGSLGIKDGGVYPVGAGFGQNFAGGKIYFTPDTGAHIMQGAILDKYLALGGPADGDLGFPNIDEGGGKAPDSRNTTFSAADNPVIFWTPDTDAHVVRGALNAAWDRLGGSAGVLGVPREDEVYRGDVVSQDFTGGQLSWNRKTGAFTTTPPELADQLGGLPIPGDATSAINTARRAAGGPMGPLGTQEGTQYKIGSDGVGQNFAGGKIFYSPATGANVVTGQVLAKYENVGGPEGDLGFPTSNEGDGGLAPASNVVSFAAPDQPVIFWTPDFGAVIVRGAMNAAWAKLGGATGQLGAPTAEQTENGDVVTQKFNGGAISWNKTTKEYSTEPAELATQLTGLEVPGLQAPQAPAQGGDDADSGGQKWWLLAIVPVAVLLIAIVVGMLLNRRRRDHQPPPDVFDDDFDHHDDDFDDVAARGDGGFDPGPLPVDPRDEGDDRDDAYAPGSMWSMPVNRGPSAPDALVPEVSRPESSDVPVTGVFAPDPDAGGPFDDQDSIDTAPTMIQSEPMPDLDREHDGHDEDEHDDFDDDEHDEDDHGDEHDDFDDDEHVDYDHEHDEDDHDEDEEEHDGAGEPVSGPPSGRHAASQLDESVPAQPSMRLATEDPFQAPEGYPIKADTKTGLYWAPGSGGYDQIRAEIWFSSEEFALTNGFVKG